MVRIVWSKLWSCCHDEDDNDDNDDDDNDDDDDDDDVDDDDPLWSSEFGSHNNDEIDSEPRDEQEMSKG